MGSHTRAQSIAMAAIARRVCLVSRAKVVTRARVCVLTLRDVDCDTTLNGGSLGSRVDEGRS